MDDQMTKSKLLETLRSKRAEWDALLAEVPVERMAESGVAGEWSVKDIIVHLTYHERWIADRLHEGLRGESYAPNEIDAIPFDERNEIVFQRNRNRPLSDVLEESRQAFRQGAPGPITIWKFLRGDVYEHYGLHTPAIRSWLQQEAA